MNVSRSIVAALISVLSFATLAHAELGTVYFDQSFEYTFTRNDFNKEVGPILIVDTDGSSITATHGIRIIIPETLYSLWEPAMTQLQLTGTAVTQGKIASVVTPVYSDDLKEVYIPVLATFTQGMDVSITGLSMRVYRTANDKRYLTLDMNGDHVGDVSNFRSIAISSTEIRTDLVAPYPLKNVTVSRVATGVRLSWSDSPDYDFDRVLITKKLTRGVLASQTTFEAYPRDKTFFDADIKAGDSIVYELISRDNSLNESEAVRVTYSEPMVAVETPNTPIAEAPVAPVENSQDRMLAQMKKAGTFTSKLTPIQLRSPLYSGFAAQIVMSFREAACSASKSHVLAQKCMQAAKKYGILKTSVSRKMSKSDFVDMLLTYFAKQGTTLVTYTAPTQLVCTNVSPTKVRRAYNAYINGQKLGFLPEGDFSCAFLKSLTREEAINIADLFFVKNIR